MSRREYMPRDQRLVSEYVINWHPDAERVWYQLPLGPPSEEAIRAAPEKSWAWWQRSRYRCDAVLINKNTLWLVEGEIRRPITAFGELLVYNRLIDLTPELQPYLTLQRRLVLVTPRVEGLLIKLFRQYGVETVIYRPKWAEEYLKTV